MIELDNGPVAIGLIIAIAFSMPFLYSLFVDRNERD